MVGTAELLQCSLFWCTRMSFLEVCAPPALGGGFHSCYLSWQALLGREFGVLEARHLMEGFTLDIRPFKTCSLHKLSQRTALSMAQGRAVAVSTIAALKAAASSPTRLAKQALLRLGDDVHGFMAFLWVGCSLSRLRARTRART